MSEVKRVFTVGFTELPDCGDRCWSSAIDVDQWGARIEVYGMTSAEATQLRDEVLTAIVGFDAAQSELAALREENKKVQKRYEDMTDRAVEFEAAAESVELGCSLALQRESALREELAGVREVLEATRIARDAEQYANEELRQSLAAADQRNAELQTQLNSIDKHLRGNVNDPDPLPPIMPGAVSYTTTYGLVAGLRRERDYLKKSATPLPAGDDYLRQLAQRLREYVGNPHHINPVSEAFKRLIDDSAFALSKLAALQPTESGASE